MKPNFRGAPSSALPRLLAVILLGLCGLVASQAVAQEVRVELASGETYGLPPAAMSWEPPTGDLADWDWLLLTSGEWIKGTLKMVRDTKVSFNSEKLGDLEISLNDIAAFYADKPKVFMMDDHRQLVGKATMRDNVLWIGDTPVKKGQLLGMLEGPPKESEYWSAKLDAALTLRQGNTNQFTTTEYLFIRREDVRSRMTLESNGTYGLTDDEPTVQMQSGLGQYDLMLWRRFYVTPAFINVMHDRFQNITARVTPGTSLGAHVIRRDGLEWDVEVGPGYQYLRYRTVMPGQKQTNHDAVLRLVTRFSVQIADPVHFDLSWMSTLIPSGDFGLTSHHGQATLELMVVQHLKSTVSVIFDRVEDPVPNDDGTKPLSNDVQLTFGVMVDF